MNSFCKEDCGHELNYPIANFFQILGCLVIAKMADFFLGRPKKLFPARVFQRNSECLSLASFKRSTYKERRARARQFGQKYIMNNINE